MSPLFCEVYVPLPLRGTFTYSVPEQFDVRPGMRVQVPFRGRKLTAPVVSLHSDVPREYQVKDIIEVIDSEPLFDERLVKLCEYSATYYLGFTGEAFAQALPSGTSPSSRFKAPFQREARPAAELTDEQDAAFHSILEGLETEPPLRGHLLHGVTGSGKTEVYIALAKKMMEEGKSVLYLVPEISLSSQIFSRLYNVFGDELVLYHSALTPNQRLHHWMKFYKGEARIAIGTRSALFMQCPELGAVIIDEEQDGSYKEQGSPRYSARRLAMFRAEEEKALVVMGSATPQIETLYSAKQGSLGYHQLRERYAGALLPAIEVVRLRGKEKQSLMSSKLVHYTREALESGNQAIFLLNRRGFAPMVMCDSCGYVAECPHCSISLNYHRDGSMHCHYCGYLRPLPSRCPKCESEDIAVVGAGTQRVEESISELIPGARVFRLDQDTARQKGKAAALVEAMEAGDVDILLGTQMVAKGFDFNRVAVVGVLMADIGMNLPDFRATERIFSLLLQVAGRGGRGQVKGRVVIQTLNEENELYAFLRGHAYGSFYERELAVRKMAGYPPFMRVLRILGRGPDAAEVQGVMSEVVRHLEKIRDPSVQILGPVEAPLSKVADNYRIHLIMKGPSISLMQTMASRIDRTVAGKKVYLEFDVDPVEML